MEGLARLAAIVAAVAASDEEVAGLAKRGELDEARLRAELPRILRTAQTREWERTLRYDVDAAYRAALHLAIYEQVVHDAGVEHVRALATAEAPIPDGGPRSLAWYRGEA